MSQAVLSNSILAAGYFFGFRYFEETVVPFIEEKNLLNART